MKTVILLLFSGFSLLPYSQKKLDKIIESDDVVKLEKYIQKNEGKIDQLLSVENENGLEESFSPMMVAFFDSSQNVLQYFIQHLELFENKSHVISEVFIHSLSEEKSPISQQLYDLGANPNDSCGACWNNNAAMVAAAYGNEDWFFKLKDSTNLSYSNPKGENLAHNAAAGSSYRIARWVFANKEIDVNQKSKTGNTPLDFAVWNREHPKMMTHLLKNGAMISEANNLLQAWPFNPTEEIFYDNLVFNRRSDVWKKDDDGTVPLIWTLVPEAEGEYDIQQLDLFARILNMMTADENSIDLQLFANENIYLFNSMKDFLAICELRGDYAYSIGLFTKFVKLCAISQENSGYRVLTKKNYKKACELFGKEAVDGIYSDNDLGIP